LRYLNKPEAHMRKFSTAALLAALMTTAAYAGEGGHCYLEGTAGVGFTANKISDAADNVSLNLASTGLVFSPGVGCDLRMGKVSIGPFVRYDFGSIGSTPVNIGGITGNQQMNGQWTVGGRLGYELNAGTMVYGLVGIAGTKADITTALSSSKQALTSTGLVLGGGAELELGKSPWALKGEYNYITFASKSGTDATSGITGASQPTENVFRVGLVYKFGWDATPAPLK